MASILYKWLMIPFMLLVSSNNGLHPIYVSVVEMEHNAKEKTLEVSCRIFTDDFERTLRDVYKTRIDLLNPKDHESMSKLVNDYVVKHLTLTVNGKPVKLIFSGYEEVEEAIWSYYQVNEVAEVKTIDINSDILYSYKKEQMNIFHLTVNGERKSSRLLNPDKKLNFSF